MKATPAIIALAISLLAAPAYAAQARKKAPEPPPPPPPQFRVDVETRSMALARLALGFPATSVVGEVGLEDFCLGKTPIYARAVFSDVPKDDYAKVFAAEASAAGYKLPAGQTDLFATGDASGPELQIAAAITSLDEHGCPGGLFTPYLTIDAKMRVEWQVFEPLEKKLLFRGSSEGTASLRRELNSQEAHFNGAIARAYAILGADGARDAFQQAAKAILADPNFVAAVRDPKGGASGQAQAGVLFPEAQTVAQPIQVVRLPLNTKPFKDQVTRLRDQVVTVLTPGGQGSGFYIADGMLLTNHHVIAGYSRVRLRFYGGREVDGEVVSSNAKRDIALIKTAPAGVAGLPLRLEPPELASTVFVIGTPARDRNEGSVISGIVSAFRNEKDGPFIQSDVAVTHGNSGGPMVDDMGNVIGLVDKGDVDAAAVNRFIPIADALKVLDIKFAP